MSILRLIICSLFITGSAGCELPAPADSPPTTTDLPEPPALGKSLAPTARAEGEADGPTRGAKAGRFAGGPGADALLAGPQGNHRVRDLASRRRGVGQPRATG